MYNFLTIAFLFFLTIVIASPSGFAKMSPKELSKLKKQITQARKAGNDGQFRRLTQKLNRELGAAGTGGLRPVLGGGIGGPGPVLGGGIGGPRPVLGGGIGGPRPGLGGGIGGPAIKQSSCLEHLKQFSRLPTFGGLIDGKNFIMDPSYTLSYSYNGNTRKYSPVLTKIINDRVVVVSPKGTARTSGRNCNGDKSETSSQLLSKWIQQSGKNVEKARRFGRSLKSVKRKKNYFKSLDRAEAQRKKILQICSSSKLGVVSIAAQKALRNSVDYGGAGHKARQGVQ